MNKTYNITEDEHIEITIEGYTQRLILAVWRYIEFLSDEIGIDDPIEIINEIEDSLTNCYLEHMLEDTENENYNDPDIIYIIEHEKKLKHAIWRHMEFLIAYVGIDYDQITDIIDNLIRESIRKYSPMEELS